MRFSAPSDVTTDLALVLLAVIWGINFSVVKAGLAEIEPLAFNALRFPLACAVLGAVLFFRKGSVVPPLEDMSALVGLGLLGNVAYQWLFIVGIDRTLAGNASIILATVPVWTALISRRLGHETLGARTWIGVAGTLAGMVMVVTGGASVVGVGAQTLVGDLLITGGAVAWALYTVSSRRLVLKHGPLRVTAWTIWIGTVVLILLGVPSMRRTGIAGLSWSAWGTVIYAGVFALAVAYVVWYRGVQRLGSSRTAVYSNLVPVVALVVAWIWLGERPSALQLLGAGVVIGSLTLTRLGTARSVSPNPAASDA